MNVTSGKHKNYSSFSTKSQKSKLFHNLSTGLKMMFDLRLGHLNEVISPIKFIE